MSGLDQILNEHTFKARGVSVQDTKDALGITEEKIIPVKKEEPKNEEEPKVEGEIEEPLEEEEPKVEGEIEEPLEEEEPKVEQEEQEEQEEGKYESMTKLQLLGELAKEEGIIDDDFKVDKNVKPDEFVKSLANKIKGKKEKEFEETYGESNFKLFKGWVQGNYNDDESRSIVNQSMLFKQLSSANIEGETEEAKKDRIALISYYYKNVKNLNESVVKAAIKDHIQKNEDLQFARNIQLYFDKESKSIIQNYESKVENEKEEINKELNNTLKSSSLKDLFIKTEKDRDKLVKAFNEKTESITIKNSKTGRVHRKRMTEAEVLLDSIYKDPKKMITIIAHLKKLNSMDDIENNLKNKNKKKIFKAFKADTEEKLKKSERGTGKYSLWDQIKESNMK